MVWVVDRRLNPKGKNIGNRQRFIRRARPEISKVVQEASSRRNVADIGQGDRVVIPSHGLKEPLFRKAHSGGTRSHVLPGNKEYVPGDKLPRPPEGGGRGGREGSPDGGGDDEFQFVLSRQEFVDLFLEVRGVLLWRLCCGRGSFCERDPLIVWTEDRRAAEPLNLNRLAPRLIHSQKPDRASVLRSRGRCRSP